MNPQAFADLKPCLLVYDVPERSGVTNPSGRLRRIAFRINLSCWVIRCDDIPHAYLNSLAGKGVSWRVVRFDASEASNLVQLGISNLKNEIRQAIGRARQAEKRAASDLANHDTTETGYATAARTNIRRLRKLLADLKSAAARFGITESQLNLSDANNAVRLIDAAMKERCAAYANMAIVIRESNVSGAAGMAHAIETDSVPHGIAADFLNDIGTEKANRAASRVRSIFD